VNDGIRRALVRAEPGSERFLVFEDPVETLVAHEPGEVPGLLVRVEQEAFRGRWVVGFVGYEAAPAFDPTLSVHLRPPGPAPLAAFASFDVPSIDQEAPREGTAKIEGRAPSLSESAYASSVARIREAIAAGSTYQVNFVFPFSGSFSGRPHDLLRRLLSAGEAPYAALIEGEEWAVLSLSPELFFERRAGLLTMRPMKGTRPRGRFGDEDRRLAAELAASEKDRAENLMIVDMVRNDLGRVARAGSVEVRECFALERYPTVWQMTSTVTAESDAGLPEIFAALFPCASVTGAPKRATMRIIRELEPALRGVYCGAVGVVQPGGDARFAVAIRTLELDTRASSFRYGVGSGVTWDSSAREEWSECLAKARVLDGAPPEFALFETMRWRPGRGIELLDLHLERLVASADFFGFAGTEASIEREARAAVAARCAGLPLRTHKMRLVLERDGNLCVDAEPFEAETRTWRLAVAREPVSSSEPLAFHKTTLRERYENARASAPPEIDEVLLVNEHGELTEGTRTNLFVELAGGWLTPPRTAGEHLLRTGQAREATLYPHDLRRAHRIRLGNALRGWIPARPA